MKKIILTLITLGLIFSSCEKFLEEDNLSSVSTESVYATKDGFNSLVNANYSQLREIYGQNPEMFCAGTDLYADGRDAGPNGLTEYTNLTPSSTGVDHLYNTCYRAILLANMALHYSETTVQTTNLPQLVGEMKFLRANAYFLLVQSYGGVGIITDYLSTPVLKFDRNSAEEVYNLIISDLTDAEAAVLTTAYTGRVNQRAVRNLLGQVYLTRGYESFGTAADFTTAATYFDQVINNQALTVTPENSTLAANEMNVEVIFSIQFSAASQATSPTTLGNRQQNYFGPYMGGSEVAGKAPYKTFTLCPTQFAISLYEQTDKRWASTFMYKYYTNYYDYYATTKPTDKDTRYLYAPKWYTVDSVNKIKAVAPKVVVRNYGTYGAQKNVLDNQTIPVKKFDDVTSTFATGNARTSTRDIVIGRLADTYLLAAEAYLKAGVPATGLLRLNVVRARAGVPAATTGQLTIDYILDERAREMLGEYNRWFDLKRTGKLVERASANNYQIKAENFVGAGGELKILRPIPQSAIDLNQNKDFPQNPAYN